jgi:hypothetical protein
LLVNLKKQAMKNPFIKSANSNLWIALGATGAVVAVAVARFFFRNNDKPAPEHSEHSTDYLKPKPGKHKKTTDIHDLQNLAVS